MAMSSSTNLHQDESIPFDPTGFGPFVRDNLPSGAALVRGIFRAYDSISWSSHAHLISGEIGLNPFGTSDSGNQILQPVVQINMLTRINSITDGNHDGSFDVDKSRVREEIERINRDNWERKKLRPIGILLADRVAGMTRSTRSLLNDLVPGWDKQQIGPVIVKMGATAEVAAFLCNGTQALIQRLDVDTSAYSAQKDLYKDKPDMPYERKERIWFDP